MTRRVADLPPCGKCEGPLLPLLACNTCGYVSILRDAPEVDRFLACPECTATNEIQLLCDRCHARHPFVTVSDSPRRRVVCPSCATFLGPGDKECPTCGEKLEAGPVRPKSDRPRRKRRVKGTRDDRQAEEIRRIPGIHELQARALLQLGYDAIWKLMRASEDDLARIPELGRKGAQAVKSGLRSVLHAPERKPRDAVLDEELVCPLCGCVTSAFSSTCLECGATFDEEEMDEDVRRSLVQDGEQGLLAFYDLHLHDDPEDAELWYARGLLLEAMGETEEAMRSLDRASTLSPKKKVAVARTRLLSKASHEPGVPDRLRSMLRDIVDETGLDEEMKAFQRSIADRGPTCPVCDEPLLPDATICPACSAVVGKGRPTKPPKAGKPPETEILDSLMDELSRPAPSVEPEPTTPASLESMVDKFEDSLSPEDLEQTRLATVDWLMEELEESITGGGAEPSREPRSARKALTPLPARPAPPRQHVSTKAGFLSRSLLRRQGLVNGKGAVNGRGRVNGYINGAGKVNGFINGRGRVNGFINGRGYVNGAGLTMVRLPTSPRRTAYAAIGGGILIAVVILVALFPLPSGLSAPIVIDGSFQDWASVPTFDAATVARNPNIQISRYASLLDRDNFYLFAATRGQTFGDGIGYDGIFFLIDADGNASTGYTFAGLGVDFLAEVDGGNSSVAAARLHSFPLGAELNWSSRVSGPSINAAASAQGLELQIPVFDLDPFDANAFRVGVYADDFEGSSSRSEAMLSRASGGILVHSRALAKIVGAGPTDLLEIEVRALGLTSAVETWTVSSFQLNATSGLTTSLSAESVNLTRDLPSASVRVAVQAPAFLPGDVVSVEIVTAAGPKPIFVFGEPARAYVVSPSPLKKVDGLFDDWAVDSVADSDPMRVNNSNVDIVRFGAAREPTTAFFYVQVAGTLLDGSVPQHVLRLPRGSGGGGPPGNASRPPRQTGEDILRVYVDTNVSDPAGVPVEGITADVLLEIKGQDGHLTSKGLYSWSNGWVKTAGQPINLAKNSSAIEGSLPIGANANGTRMVFMTTDWSGISDVTRPAVAVVQAPPPSLLSFSLHVNAPEFEVIAAPMIGTVLLGIAFLRLRRRRP